MLLCFRYKANVFSSKRERTYEMLLQDMYDNYWSHGTDPDSGRANSGSIKLYGSQRKTQEQMVRKSPSKSFVLHKAAFRILLSRWVKPCA